jgi:hypothetical protein
VYIHHSLRLLHIPQTPKHAPALKQRPRAIKFDDLALLQHEDLVEILNGLQSMGDDYQRPPCELLPDQGLDQLVGSVVETVVDVSS